MHSHGLNDPPGNLEAIDSISEHDKTRLQTLNGEMPQLVNSLIHNQIETQSEHHPLEQAVCAWDGVLTYGELNQRASTLARSLVGAGVEPGDYVPLLFEKSKWYIVAIFAVGFLYSMSLKITLIGRP